MVDEGTITSLIAVLSSLHSHISEKAVQALRNIAGNGLLPMISLSRMAKKKKKNGKINTSLILLVLIVIDLPSLAHGYLYSLIWTLSNLYYNNMLFPL